MKRMLQKVKRGGVAISLVLLALTACSMKQVDEDDIVVPDIETYTRTHVRDNVWLYTAVVDFDIEDQLTPANLAKPDVFRNMTLKFEIEFDEDKEAVFAANETEIELTVLMVQKQKQKFGGKSFIEYFTKQVPQDTVKGFIDKQSTMAPTEKSIKNILESNNGVNAALAGTAFGGDNKNIPAKLAAIGIMSDKVTVVKTDRPTP